MQRWLSAMMVFPLWIVLTGCSHVVIDPDGSKHISGLMVLTIIPSHQDIAADIVRIRTLGLTVINGIAIGSQFTLGYSDTTIAAIKNDASVSQAAIKHAIREEQIGEE
ncbi:MAG: hypothetical protein EOO81_08760 [Oxalobacteraceae bacterium]|nr:MAG: hypothetical protein EOO81_08760 [Oxalobacteraceae bacterium]